MPIPPVIDAILHRPGMFVAPETLECVLAFICGYDSAMSGGLLVGFHEWLVTRLGYGCNLAWTALVREILESEKIHEDSGKSIARLLAILEEFFAIRDKREGLQKIFVQYHELLNQQE